MTSPHASQPEHVYRPSFESYKKYLIGALAAGSAFVIALLLQIENRSGAGMALIVLLIGIAIGIGYVTLYIKRAHIIISSTEVRYRGIFKTISLSRGGLRSILVNYGSTNPPIVTLMILEPLTKKKFRLNGGLWSQTDQKVILDLLKGEDLLAQHTITARQLYKTHPDFVRGFERGFGMSPAVSAFVIVITTLLVISAVIFLGVILNSR